jgi:hypothetical protein
MILDGKVLAKQIKDELKEKISNSGKEVALAVVLVGEDPASCIYVRNKTNDCHEIGVKSLEYKLPETTTQEELMDYMYFGFDIDDIESNCDLFINGHIHHYGIHNNIINVGNLTGQNFTEDFSYKHGVYVLDTEAVNGLWVDNPYAIYFDKLDLTKIYASHNFMNIIDSIDKNCVLTIKVNEDFALTAKQLLANYVRPRIIEYRLIVDRIKNIDYNKIEIEEIDHLKQFETYVLDNIGDSQIVRDELAALLK